jgi:hypothetical protein
MHRAILEQRISRLPTHTGKYKAEKRGHTCMSRVGLEHETTVLELCRTVNREAFWFGLVETLMRENNYTDQSLFEKLIVTHLKK